MRVLLMNIVWFVLAVSLTRFVHGKRRHFSFRVQGLPSFADKDSYQPIASKKALMQKRSFELLEGELCGSGCCPSVTGWVNPLGGVSVEGDLLEINSDTRYQQLFQQTSCVSKVPYEDCADIASRYRSSARCVQKHAYMLAMVRKHYGSDQSYHLDYIRVNSSCACAVTVERNV